MSSAVSKFFSGGANLASGLATTAAAGAQAVASNAQTDTFLLGMQQLTQESNKVQLQMGYMNLQKTLVEGFAKFIREMGKGFTMQ